MLLSSLFHTNSKAILW